MLNKNNRTKNYLKFLLASISFSIIYLLVLGIFRAVFYIGYAPEGLNDNYFSDVLSAFFLGFRFDLQIVSYLLIIPVMVYIILFLFLKKYSGKQTEAIADQRPRRFFSIYYTVSTILLTFISLVDYYYYAYFQDHIDFMFFGLFDDDTMELVIIFWKNYPLIQITLAFILITFLVYKATVFILKQLWIEKLASKIVARVSSRIVWSLVPILIIFLLARGTFSLFPLTITKASISTNQFVNKIAVNGVLAFHRAYMEYSGQKKYASRKSYSERYGFKKNIDEALKIWGGTKKAPEGKTLLDKITRRTPRQNTGKPHVVLVIMESFGSYWLQYNSSDFNIMGELAEHLNSDYYFPNFTSATGNTIGSTTALITNSPGVPGVYFLSEGKYSKLSLSFAAALPFKKAGYTTRFLYSGSAGWRNMNDYYVRQGFDSIESENTIRGKLNKPAGTQVGNEWSVKLYDEYLFEYLFKELSEAKSPQFIVILTTTNHPPYDLPDTYQPLSLKIPPTLKENLIGNKKLLDQRFMAFQYSNHQVGKFLTKIKNSSLKNKTVIAITGDHGFRAVNFETDQSFQKFMVPLYIYTPEHIVPKYYASDTFGSHIDIIPTLYNLTLSNVTYQSLGFDLFARSGGHRSIYMSQIYSSEGAVRLRGKGRKYFNWDFKIPGKFDILKPTKKPTRGLKKIENEFHATMMITEALLEEQLKNSEMTKR
ncbi:MAG: LTA synthase family protein [Leptospirales bacterium]